MLGWLVSTGQASDRKLRLFAVGCCRRIWDVLEFGTGRDAVEVADRFADGRASLALLQTAHAQMKKEAEEWDRWVPYESADLENAEAAWAACAATGPIPSPMFLKVADRAANAAVGGGKRLALPTEFHPGEPLKPEIQRRLTIEAQAQCNLLRDIFGTTPIDPAWLTPDVVGLARTIYDGREFNQLPILAEALIDAGCNAGKLLSHCCEQELHVRGCWAIDRLLGMV
jgi:hypothetical protein